MSDSEIVGKIGEVIEANTTGFHSECYELHRSPAFGSFVTAKDGAYEIYGVVSNIETASLDPGRRALARGRGETDPEDVYRHNPELPELLRTQFETVVIGFAEDSAVHVCLPPQPPRLHAFVYPCPATIIEELTKNLSFLQTLLVAAHRAGSDELVSAAVRQATTGRSYLYKVAVGKELARLLVNEPQRLNAILKRLAV
jgi:hypothetical protein